MSIAGRCRPRAGTVAISADGEKELIEVAVQHAVKAALDLANVKRGS